MASVRRSFSSQVSLSSAMIFSVSWYIEKRQRTQVIVIDRRNEITVSKYQKIFSKCIVFIQHIPLFGGSIHHLQPLNGFLTSWTEHNAVMQTGDGSSTAGQGWEGRRRTHPCHGISHCGEITPLIDSLTCIVIVLVIRQACQGGVIIIRIIIRRRRMGRK